MKIIVAGASGQVGKEVLKKLKGTEHGIVALVRKLGALPRDCQASNISESVFDYEQSSYLEKFNTVSPDLVLCCLGTTMKKAGSVEAFNRVDRDYPVRLLSAFQEVNPQGVFALVSSVGANQPTGTYLKAKYEVEQAMLKSGLRYVVVRPSFLRSEREEFRIGEVIVEKVFTKPYLFLTEHLAPKSETLWKYAPIEVAKVASVLVERALALALNPNHASLIIEGSQFYSKTE